MKDCDNAYCERSWRAKNEILDAANELFFEKGFDATSTADILEKVGIARGTFYCHFKSKEDIMDALIARPTAVMLLSVQSAAKQNLPVIDRIVSVVFSINMQEDCGGEMLSYMHNPQNALMHQKVQKTILKNCQPARKENVGGKDLAEKNISRNKAIGNLTACDSYGAACD